MTTAALTIGTALIAFSPTLSLLLLLTYSKAQLTIVVTTSAFFFLLSSLLASLFWILVPDSLRESAILMIPLSVASQGLLRCAFVWVYHRVEDVILRSIRRHEQQQQRSNYDESAQLRLELNDWSCGIAAGVGFGFMHTVMLYGTLLASESGSVGTLYQDSCQVMPSLVNSSLNAMCFGILDLVWMLFTFFGMRRRRHCSTSSLAVPQIGHVPNSTGNDWREGEDPNKRWGSMIPNTRQGGNAAIGITLLLHLAAGFATTANKTTNGCLVALPILTSVVVISLGAFWIAVSRIYLPDNQRKRLILQEGNRHTTDDETLVENSHHYD